MVEQEFLILLAQPVETELPHVEVKDFFPFIALSDFWEKENKKQNENT